MDWTQYNKNEVKMEVERLACFVLMFLLAALFLYMVII